jgi:transposase
MSEHRTKRAFTVLATRREWSASEKRRIVAEALEPGANVSAVARGMGLRPHCFIAGARMPWWPKA